MAKIKACESVIATIDKALKVLDKGFLKVNVLAADDPDFSGPITIPLQQVMRAVSVYFKALRAGHGNKKAVKTLGKQLKTLGTINDDGGESFRAVQELLRAKT
jgi:hypothetical protein